MGSPDNIMVPCPNCGHRNCFQSKGGDASCRTFNLEHAPLDVLSDVNRHAPIECEECKISYMVDIESPEATPVLVGDQKPENPKVAENRAKVRARLWAKKEILRISEGSGLTLAEALERAWLVGYEQHASDVSEFDSPNN